jgi:hypothetical protein
MDRFIRSVRLDWKLLQMMAAAGEFSIMGIVQRDEIQRRWIFRRRLRLVSPLLLIPTANAGSRNYIVLFERQHTLCKIKIPFLPLYRSRRGSPEKSMGNNLLNKNV